MKRNPVKEALLRVLRAAPGQWQSGEALAEAAGVTRSAVWKAAGAVSYTHLCQARLPFTRFCSAFRPAACPRPL